MRSTLAAALPSRRSAAANSLTLTGPVNLSSNALTITVTSPLVTGTISGAMAGSYAGSGSLIKNGAGTLLLTGNNGQVNWSGANAIQILNGVLQISGSDSALGRRAGHIRRQQYRDRWRRPRADVTTARRP